jgi:hypothetical protein
MVFRRAAYLRETAMKKIVKSFTSPNRFLREQSSALKRHLDQCDLARGRLFPAALLAESVHDFVAPRIVSTVAIVTILFLLVGGL